MTPTGSRTEGTPPDTRARLIVSDVWDTPTALSTTEPMCASTVSHAPPPHALMTLYNVSTKT